MYILGLDLGSKTCGMAIVNLKQNTPIGLCNYEYAKNDLMQVVNKIKQVVKDYNNEITTIVLGCPYNHQTSNQNESELRVMKFKTLLEQAFSNIQIVLHDENFSTSKATEMLMQYEIKASQRKKVIDMVSAIVILQDYLDKTK